MPEAVHREVPESSSMDSMNRQWPDALRVGSSSAKVSGFFRCGSRMRLQPESIRSYSD